MKSKKFLTAIGAVAMATVFSLSAFAGCKKEEHAYNWTIDKEATCSSEGKKTGVCGICGDVKEEKIPVDPKAHVYGDWAVEQPTETADGSAKKVCTINASHELEVTLPKITAEGTGYLSSEVTKESTVFSYGERTFVYEHESGNVTFIQQLPLKPVETVEDAVLLGASRGNLVRKASGRFSDAATVGDVKYTTFTTEIYDDHTIVTDNADHAKQYFSRDDNGKVFGIEVLNDSNEPKAMERVTESCLLGYGYDPGVGNGLRTYGAEQTLQMYYQKGKDARSNNKAVKYTEKIIDMFSDGGLKAMFHFSYYEGYFFCRYTVEFTLDAKGVIVSLTLTTNVIRPYMIAVDDNGELRFDEDGDVIFGIDEDTGLPYSDDHDEISVRKLIYDAPVLKTENDVQPKNPYDSNVKYIKDFTVSYGGKALAEDGTHTFPSLKDFNLEILDVKPDTADLDYDPLRVYVRTPARDTELTLSASDNEYGLIGFFDKDLKVITLKSNSAGAVTIVIKTKGGKAEKVLNLEFSKSPPSTINAEAYVYSDSDGKVNYTWLECDTTKDNAVSVYVGQALKFRSNTSKEELPSADLTFIALLSDSDQLEYSTLTEEEFEGRDIYSFVASRAGLYDIWIRYPDRPSVATHFYVNVLEKPDLSTLIDGVYEGNLANVLIGGSGKPSAVSVTFEQESGSLSGKVHIQVGDLSSHYNYTYNAEDKTFALTYYDGISVEENFTFDFSLKFNEAYRLVLTHTNTFGGGAEKESVVLSRPKAEE